MPVNEQERSVRRRLIFAAMNGNATPTAIEKAIDTLDNEFGDVEEIRFNQVIRRFQQTLDATEANLNAVLGKVMTLRQKPAEELGPDPRNGVAIQPRSPSERGPSPGAATRRVGLHHVFATMVETFVAHLRNLGNGSDRHLLEALLQSPEIEKLPPRVAKAIQDWTQSPQGTLEIQGTVEDYRTVIHAIYVWLCQKLGPVDADRLLSGVVRTAEALPEAATNSPRQLL
ncbi:MAG: hypothetical protein AAFX06_13175 [Planctomycetota bacterium]